MVKVVSRLDSVKGSIDRNNFSEPKASVVKSSCGGLFAHTATFCFIADFFSQPKILFSSK